MYILDVKMPIQLLQSLVQVLQGPEQALTLEGDLSQLDIQLLENTIERDWPQSGKNSVVEIPLTPTNAKALIESILPRIGVHRRVYHAEIAEVPGGKLLFAAFDNFSRWKGIEGRYNKGAGVTSGIDVALLDDLMRNQVIRKYEFTDNPSASWD